MTDRTLDKALGFFRSFNFEKPGLNEAVSRYGGDVMMLWAMCYGESISSLLPNDFQQLSFLRKKLKIYALSPLSGLNFRQYLLKKQKKEGKNSNLRREPLKQKQK
ncbi:MAG: hypothetical protein PVH61_14015 [Candidatus Aminicenantes bacterium]